MATRPFYVFDLRQKVISTRGDVSPDPYIVARAGLSAGSSAGVAIPQSIGMGYMYGQSIGVATTAGRSQFLTNGRAAAVGAVAGLAAVQGYGVAGIFRSGAGSAAGVAALDAVGVGRRTLTGAGAAAGFGSAVAYAISPDPYYVYVSLLVAADGTDGATTAADQSSNLRTLTASGTATLSTARKKNGTASMWFGDTVGAGGRFVVVSSSTLPAGFNLVPNDFTLQLSYYMPVSGDPTPASVPLFSLGRHWTDTTTSASGIHGFALEWETGGALRAKFTNGQTGATVTVAEAATTAPYNRFCDISVTKAGSTVYLHVDGALMAQATLAGGALSFPTLLDCNVGGSQSFSVSTGAFVSALPGVGNIDDLRLTVGYARFGAANYTPSPSPFPSY